MPGIIEIYDEWSPAKKCAFQSRGQPRQGFLFDPDQVVSPSGADLAQPAPIGIDKVLQAARFAAKEPSEILIVQKRRDRHPKPGTFQDGQIVVVPHAAAGPVAFIACQTQDRIVHSRTSPDMARETRRFSQTKPPRNGQPTQHGDGYDQMKSTDWLFKH